MSKVIAICNQKGGVGKTSTTVNLSSSLAKCGYKVLAIDADPQGDLTKSFGYRNGLPFTLSTELEKIIKDEPVMRGCVLHSKESVDIIPSSIEFASMEMKLIAEINREQILKVYINEIKCDYDYVLIDCPPSLGMITLNALTAADSVIIPVEPQILPAEGMTELVKTIGKLKRVVNPNLSVEGILLNLVDERTNLTKATINTIRENYGNRFKIFNTRIPLSVRAAEAPGVGKSVIEYDSKSKVSEAYQNLAQEVTENAEISKRQNRPTLAR